MLKKTGLGATWAKRRKGLLREKRMTLKRLGLGSLNEKKERKSKTTLVKRKGRGFGSK